MNLQEVQLKELDRKYAEYIQNYRMNLYDVSFSINDETLVLLNSHINSMNDTEIRCINTLNEEIWLNKKSIKYLVYNIVSLREKIRLQYKLNKKYILNNTKGFIITFHVN